MLTACAASAVVPAVARAGGSGLPTPRRTYDLRRGMYVVITGSGSALVDPERGNASQAVVIDGTVLQFDCGRRTMDNLALVGINPVSVDYILFTHLHFDHIVEYGYFVIASWIGGREEPFKVFGPSGTRKMSDGAVYGMNGMNVDFVKGIVWPDHPLGGPRQEPPVDVRDVQPGVVVETPQFKVTAAETSHFAPANAAKGMYSLGYRVESEHGAVAISGDTAPCDGMRQLARNVDVLVHECVMPDVGMASGGKFNVELTENVAGKTRTGHTRPAELGQLAKEVGAKKLVATHLGPFTSVPAAVEMSKIYTGPNQEGPEFWTRFSSAIARAYDGPIVLAEDALVIPVGGAAQRSAV
jgi:ribonuclease Z